MYRPLEFVVVETERFVPILVTVTLAFGIAAPDGSLTTPVNCPFWTWANVPSATSSVEMATRQNRSFFIDLPPSRSWDVVQRRYLENNRCQATLKYPQQNNKSC